MKPRADVTGLTTGLLFLLLGVVGLWAAFGSVDWPTLGFVLPFVLVAIGMLGLNLTRGK